MKSRARSERAAARRRAAPARRPVRGFTLLELLVAIALLAVVAVLSWRGLDQIARANRALEAQITALRALGAALDQIGTDARHAATDEESLGAAVALRGGALMIVRRVDLPDGARRLQVIRYRVVDGRLLRQTSPALATVGQMRGALAGVSGGTEVALVDDVRGFGVRVWIDGRGLVDGIPATPPARAQADVVPVVAARQLDGLQVQLQVGDTPRVVTRLMMVGQ
ncbi:PulJ/GspJ family protein [Chitinasiproducens palmae]|uniref:General secretion pathway protein J n=1 Tax=Chitinasiproducens palmae TaxID=1770053 RepID=A0A1H2PPB6_9BURK|nr:prepilin-type N-terminal cleavage/methylation domain-containing protein [Chitinasiproducens palmae]SDV48482.1 general secretion pathway protein J [Chitinasiproducens palmae]